MGTSSSVRSRRAQELAPMGRSYMREGNIDRSDAARIPCPGHATLAPGQIEDIHER